VKRDRTPPFFDFCLFFNKKINFQDAVKIKGPCAAVCVCLCVCVCQRGGRREGGVGEGGEREICGREREVREGKESRRKILERGRETGVCAKS
jgi:hypothetical protein